MPKRLMSRLVLPLASFRDWLRRWTRPSTRPLLGYVLDRLRSPEDLARENALLRKQLEVACRQITRPRFTPADRGMLVLLARLSPTWRNATLLVQPETILRWHRQAFQFFWRRKSKRTGTPPRIGADTIALIETMARKNRLWGAERIRGELLKLNIRVAKHTIQRYMQRVRQPRPPGQRWGTFLRNHAHDTWACDFLQTYDVLFRPIFAFFLIELGSRRVVHVGVTRSPSSAWVSQQLREATPWSEGPRFLIRDNDDKFGARFDEVAAGTGIEILRTPIRAPNANAFCERFLRSVRAECLDHVLIFDEDHLASILRCYCAYFNDARPHQGIAQKIPNGPPEPPAVGATVEATPILGGLHHDYRLAA